MSDVTWEPIQGDELYEPDPYQEHYLQYYGDDELAWVEAVGQIELPPDVRLCRAVPVTWSQEPPSEEGRYWFAGVITAADTNSRYVGEIYADDQPILVFVSNGRVVYEGIVWRTQHVHGYWLPATVPQTPGEVGP